ncbi:unnamed protein product [Lota lota]
MPIGALGQPSFPSAHGVLATHGKAALDANTSSASPKSTAEVGPISSPGQLQLLWLIAPGEIKTQAREVHDMKGRAPFDDQGLVDHLTLEISCRRLDVVTHSGYADANDTRSASKEAEMRSGQENKLISKDQRDMALPCHAVCEHHSQTPPPSLTTPLLRPLLRPLSNPRPGAMFA